MQKNCARTETHWDKDPKQSSNLRTVWSQIVCRKHHHSDAVCEHCRNSFHQSRRRWPSGSLALGFGAHLCCHFGWMNWTMPQWRSSMAMEKYCILGCEQLQYSGVEDYLMLQNSSESDILLSFRPGAAKMTQSTSFQCLLDPKLLWMVISSCFQSYHQPRSMILVDLPMYQ